MRKLMFVFALAHAACQVGNPLVDELKLDDGNLKIQCHLPPRCVPFPLEAEAPGHLAEPVSLKPCMKVCGWGEIEQEGCPQEPPIAELPVSAMCRDIVPAPMPEGSELSLSGMDWQDVNISLHAERPLRVIWSGGRLQHVYIELHGPIDLLMEQLEPFEDVRIQAEASSAGDPRVELADLEGETLSLGTEDKLLAGNIKLRAVHIRDLDARVNSLTIENTLLEMAGMRADSLTLTDVTMRGGVIDVKNARMSVFVIEDANLQFCGDARLVAGTVVRSNVRSCPDATLRVYNSTLGTCAVDGSIELDDTSVENVALGVSDFTRVLAFDSRVMSTQACAHTQLLAFGRGSTLKCSGCSKELDSEDAQPACVLDETFEALLKNYCEIWSDREALPVCEEDLPDSPDRIR